jgi:hypothetical protein
MIDQTVDFKITVYFAWKAEDLKKQKGVSSLLQTSREPTGEFIEPLIGKLQQLSKQFCSQETK